MTFIEAVQALKDKKCRGIKRLDWGDSSVVWLMGMESLCICDLNAIGDPDHPSREMYSPCSFAVLADDWTTVNQRLPDGLFSQVPDAESVAFQLGIMRNVEREIPKRKRKSTQNWVLVQDYLLGHTSKGGSTSCCIHCRWMGVDPDGYTFRGEI